MLDSEENIHIITPPPSRARQECVSRLMLGISSCPTLISIYADNAVDPDYGGESNLSPPPCIYLPTCNAFPFKERGAAAACTMFYGKGGSTCQSEAGEWNEQCIGDSGRRAHLARIGCCLLVAPSYQDRCARATNEVFAQSATVLPFYRCSCPLDGEGQSGKSRAKEGRAMR